MRVKNFLRFFRTSYIAVCTFIIICVVLALGVPIFLSMNVRFKDVQHAICPKCNHTRLETAHEIVGLNMANIQQLRDKIRKKDNIIKELKQLLSVKCTAQDDSMNDLKLGRKVIDETIFVNPIMSKTTAPKIKEEIKKTNGIFPIWSFDKKFLYQSFTQILNPKLPLNRNVTKGMVEVLKLYYEKVCSFLIKERGLISNCSLLYGSISIDLNNGLEFIFVLEGSQKKFHEIAVRNNFEKSVRIQESGITDDRKSLYIVTIASDSIPLPRIMNFLSMLRKLNISDQKITLIFVLYTDEQSKQRVYTEAIERAIRKDNKIKIKISHQHGNFQRAKARHHGVSQIAEKDGLLMFVDIDIYFTSGFLQRCQVYTKKGKSLYYPIVFSLYNPSMVLKKIPKKTFVVSKRFGVWRKTGYGNFCVYKSDYLDIGGFNVNITGWGVEDNDLYQR